jgi:hypothetical protein
MAINVQGSTFDLYTPDTDTLDQAASMAAEYSTLITRTPSAPENPVALRAIFQRLTVQFSRAEVDRIALADAAGFRITDEQLKRDITHWYKVENVIEEHHARHRENGRNQERATKFLANDPQFNIVKQNITDGGHIDTPPDFERARPIEPFRHMQNRLLPVYQRVVAKIHDKQKALLFRLSDLTTKGLQNIHCTNEYYCAAHIPVGLASDTITNGSEVVAPVYWSIGIDTESGLRIATGNTVLHIFIANLALAGSCVHRS